MRRIVGVVFALAVMLALASVALAGPRSAQYGDGTTQVTTPEPTPVNPTPVEPTPVNPTPVNPTPVNPVSPTTVHPTTTVVSVAGATVAQPKPSVVKSATNALPFTGFPLGIALAGGIALLGTGLVLRRMGRADSDK